MSIKRRQYRAEEKVSILKLHLVEKKPVSEVCEQFNLVPNLFYRWLQEFFQNGTAAFEWRRERSGSKSAGWCVHRQQSKQLENKEANSYIFNYSMKQDVGNTEEHPAEG